MEKRCPTFLDTARRAVPREPTVPPRRRYSLLRELRGRENVIPNGHSFIAEGKLLIELLKIASA